MENDRNTARVLLAGVAFAALVAGGPAWAAEAEADAAADVGEVVVAGRPIAESEAAALEVQRLSESLVTVAASDAVGRLPDQNIAQAGRLSGVAVQRAQDGISESGRQNFKLVAWRDILRTRLQAR